ncbi:hypothetical protein C9J48_12790 [Photobacterium profundum]|uniref:Uncharacterized protein n=1 Tax=Photobacterium profundum 3TCK TaxID=314280 RepID=Q1Z6B1_9GAMM|nr:hypothetical protein [Photobacterium profundum]EAS43933.1 hypothetical protein P3TCK_12131 [Photobacterium profundum 3TCK]PSV61869.1 hypothetical protein C9J48_12790 [Photobacterium profundum]
MKSHKISRLNKTIKSAVFVSCCFSATAIASGISLLPYPLTSNLYALENNCDCVLKISPEKDITITITKQQILYALFQIGGYYDNVDFEDAGIVALSDGTVIFALTAEGDYGTGAYLMKKNKYGMLTVLLHNDDITSLTGGGDPDLDGLVAGFDGFLYVGEDEEDMILKVNPHTGYAEIFIEKEDLEQLGDGFDFDVQAALSADYRYIYTASDDTPNIVYRIPYKYGKPEVFAAGPNVDPHDLSRDNYVFIVNDNYDPPVGYTRYQNESGYFSPLKPTNITGTFTLTFDHEYGANVTTDPINWDATSHEVAYAIQQALYLPIDVRGIGTIGSPWTFNNLEHYTLDDINDDYLYNADARREDESSDSKEAVEANNHIEALGTDAYSGTITIQFDARITSGSSSEEKDLGTISWQVGDSAYSIQNKLIEETHLSKEDIAVSGKGTLYNPWVFKFFGGFEKTQIDFDLINDDYYALSSEDILAGTIQDARAFDDPDGYMTRSRTGIMTLADDSGAHFIYNIDPAGKVRTLVTEWDLIKTNGGSVDMEGGLAYDRYGNLFASNPNDNDDVGEDNGANIFKITPHKNISIWVDAEDIIAITYGDKGGVDVQGIAFEYGYSAPSRYSPYRRY